MEHTEDIDETTPTSPSPAPGKAHGDAFLDQSGSRHGEEPSRGDEEEGDEE
jgi:hypothetical protein